jgi:HSP20 family protein
MTLVRLQPFRNITTLHREMDRLFDNIIDRYEDVVATNAFVPAAEMYADGENLYLQLEVPGLKPEELEVQANAYAVTITGERQEDKHSEQQGLKKSEFRYGKFHRTINFSEKIQVDRVAATYEHGILKLTLPKAEDDKNKTVKVLVGTEQLPELN